jgi:hypothetical protein
LLIISILIMRSGISTTRKKTRTPQDVVPSNVEEFNMYGNGP